MPETVQNILTNLGTSIVVGLFTFAIGMKKGKNQADRSKVQKIYTKLLNEFESINATLSLQPKILSDYPCEREWYRETYITPLREIIMGEEDVFLSDSQKDELILLEKDSFAYGEKALDFAKRIPSILDTKSMLFKVPGELLRNKPLFNSQFDNWYVMGDVMSSSDYRHASIYSFFDSRLLAEEIEEGSSVDFSDGRRPSNVRAIIIPEELKVSPDEFAKTVNEELILNEEGRQLKVEKEKIEERLDKAVKLLRRRARDPFPFWLTLGSAIRDIFRKK